MSFRLLIGVLMVLFFCEKGPKVDMSIKQTLETDLKNLPVEITFQLRPLYEQLKKNPMDKQIYNNLGDIYFKSGNMDNARLMFDFAIRIDSNYVPALFNLGVIEAKGKNLEKSVVFLEKVYKNQPDHIKAITNLCQIYYHLNQLKKSLEFAIIAFNLKPNDSQIAYNVAAVYQSLGDMDMAKDYFEKSIQLDPNNENSKMRLNQLLYQKTQKKK